MSEQVKTNNERVNAALHDLMRVIETHNELTHSEANFAIIHFLAWFCTASYTKEQAFRVTEFWNKEVKDIIEQVFSHIESLKSQ